MLADDRWRVACGSWLVAGGWWLVAGGWWLVAGGLWLVAGGGWLVAGGSWLVARGWWLVAGDNRRLFSIKYFFVSKASLRLCSLKIDDFLAIPVVRNAT